jgi:hypothetical protein
MRSRSGGSLSGITFRLQFQLIAAQASTQAQLSSAKLYEIVNFQNMRKSGEKIDEKPTDKELPAVYGSVSRPKRELAG